MVTYTANKIENVEIVVLDLNDFHVPIYGADFENKNGIPEVILKFNNHLESADGLIISLAEYNGSYATVFKNILDWLSRIDQKVWKNKPMFLISTSPGAEEEKRL